jgi:hypothetical protein
MKYVTFVVISLLSAIALTGASRGVSDVERQFRADLEIILTSSWPNAPATKFTGDRFQKLVDEILEGTKAQTPDLLLDAAKDENPSDEALKIRYAEMRRVKNDEDRREETYPSMTLFYLQRWRSTSLTRLQRVIFLRSLDAVIAEVERNKRELERLRKKANKAPEPTLGTVNFFAGSGVFHVIASVAHL